jgi:hypothetical protein
VQSNCTDIKEAADEFVQPERAYNRKKAFKPNKQYINVFTESFFTTQVDFPYKSFVGTPIHNVNSKFKPGKMN